MHESWYWTGAFTSQFQQLIFVQTTLELCGSDICHQPIRFFIDFHPVPNVRKQAGPYIHGYTTSDRGSCYGIWSLEASPVNDPTWTGLLQTSTPWSVKIFKWFLKNMLQKRAAGQPPFSTYQKLLPSQFTTSHATCLQIAKNPRSLYKERRSKLMVLGPSSNMKPPDAAPEISKPQGLGLGVGGPPTPSNGKHRCWHVWKKQVLVQDELTKPPLYK